MLEKIRIYAKITNLWGIARRYFVNNFYDGMLTVLGVLLGFFVLVLKGTETSIESNFILLAGLGSSISMFMSGITGSYLSERAEQKKLKEELDKAMGIGNQEENESIKGPEVKEIEKAMIMKIKNRVFMKSNEKVKTKKIKTLQENAERFASIVVSIINGGSPFLGGVIPLIPFLFVTEATISVFIMSFFIILMCIILLGVFLGLVSKESIIKNIFQMAFAFIMTVVISLFLLG